MELIRWIRGSHRGIRFMFETAVYNVLKPEQFKARPGSTGNSVAWLMWHMSRTEDAIVNSILRGRQQILMADAWSEKLGVDARHIGTGLADEEVEGFIEGLNHEACNEYWISVAEQTSQWLKTLAPDFFDEIPDFEARQSEIPHLIASDGANSALDFWRGRSNGFIFGGSIVNHGFIHVGEMMDIAGRLGKHGWF